VNMATGSENQPSHGNNSFLLKNFIFNENNHGRPQQKDI
jgi:hypothetical protein